LGVAFLYARARLHWGFITRQVGASAAQLAYPLPPPTTVIGSFANPLARVLGIGEAIDRRSGAAGSRIMRCAISSTIAASAGLVPRSPTGVALHAEPTRILGGPYKGGGSYQEAVKKPAYQAVQEVLPVQSSGEASSPGSVMYLAWVLDTARLEACLGLRGSSLVDGLEEAVWSVYRIGSKEGIASVEEAGVVEDSVRIVGPGGTFHSILYQSALCVYPKTGSSKPLTLYGLTYRERTFYAPIAGASGYSYLYPPVIPELFEVRSGCRAFDPGVNNLALASEEAGMP